MNVLSLFDGMSCGQIALDKLGIKVDNTCQVIIKDVLEDNAAGIFWSDQNGSCYIEIKEYEKEQKAIPDDDFDIGLII